MNRRKLFSSRNAELLPLQNEASGWLEVVVYVNLNPEPTTSNKNSLDSVIL